MAIQKALIDQLVRSLRGNTWTLAFRTDLTSFGPYFKTAVQIFSHIDCFLSTSVLATDAECSRFINFCFSNKHDYYYQACGCGVVVSNHALGDGR